MTWQEHAACLGKSDLFFPGQGADHVGAAKAALAICSACPVFADCDADTAAYETDEVYIHGFRAGLTAEQRRQRHKARYGRLSGTRRANAVRALELYEQGWVIHSIAQHFDTTDRTIARWLRDARALRLEAA